jgi:hypothetical protein
MGTDIINACVKQKGEEESGEDEREVRESSESVSHSTVLKYYSSAWVKIWVQMQ